MSLRIKLKVDDSDFEDFSKELEKKVNAAIKKSLKEYDHNQYSRSKLDELIELLVEKDVIKRSEIS